MIVSFILNLRLAFRCASNNVTCGAEALRFVTTTLVGVFVIQNLSDPVSARSPAVLRPDGL